MSKEEIRINGVLYVPKTESKATQHFKSAKLVGLVRCICSLFRCIRITLKGKKYVIARTYSAGVFAGYLNKKQGKEVTLLNARRLWYWDGASSLSQLAMQGVTKPQNCKFPVEVAEVTLTEVIEIIPCTEKARLNIKGVPIWEQK